MTQQELADKQHQDARLVAGDDFVGVDLSRPAGGREQKRVIARNLELAAREPEGPHVHGESQDERPERVALADEEEARHPMAGTSIRKV